MLVLTLLHVLAAILWVGGMAFAHLCLRPAAEAVLPPPLRLPLMAGALSRFFVIAAISAAVLVVTGHAMIVWLGGMAAVTWPVHIMLLLGWVMAGLLAYLLLVPRRRLVVAVAAADWPQAAAALKQVRLVVTVNLALGLVTSGLGASARWVP
ncbi:MAG: CopD family protein [Alphaproteobacteria bacterium]|nr:CopD family protein [Alphaproteobacteria bacterium]